MDDLTLIEACDLKPVEPPAYSSEETDLLWALVRAYKPDVIIETGVDKGCATIALVNALHLNGKGILLGFDPDPANVEIVRGKMIDTPGIAAISSLPIQGALAKFEWPADPRVMAVLQDAHSQEWLLRNYYLNRGAIIVNKGIPYREDDLAIVTLLRSVYMPTRNGLTIAEVL